MTASAGNRRTGGPHSVARHWASEVGRGNAGAVNGCAELSPTANLWRTNELLEQGLNSRAIAALVRKGVLVRIRRGCYARGSWWTGLKTSGRRRQLVHAHAHGTRTTSAGGFVYSHTSSASLRRLHLWDVDEVVHLTQSGRPSETSHGRDVVAHTRKLTSRDVSFVEGLPCTSLERTVVDCCLMFNLRQSIILIDHAARLGADLPLLREQGAALAGRAGVVTLRQALKLADPRSESAGESLTRELIHRLRIPAPELQYVVHTAWVITAWTSPGEPGRWLLSLTASPSISNTGRLKR
ncbi:type IV toxin-antitoxin system AbiEi family antitoxin domain-containing protein [Arthrobacter sp. D3-16]